VAATVAAGATAAAVPVIGGPSAGSPFVPTEKTSTSTFAPVDGNSNPTHPADESDESVSVASHVPGSSPNAPAQRRTRCVLPLYWMRAQYHVPGVHDFASKMPDVKVPDTYL